MKINLVILVHMFAWVSLITGGSEGEKVDLKKKVGLVAGGRTIKLASTTPDTSTAGTLKDENVKHASSLLPTAIIDTKSQPNAAESLPYPIVQGPLVKPVVDLQGANSFYYGPYVKYFPIPYGHHHHSYKHFGKKFGFRLGPIGVGLGLGLGLGKHYNSYGYPGFYGFHKGFHKTFHFFG